MGLKALSLIVVFANEKDCCPAKQSFSSRIPERDRETGQEKTNSLLVVDSNLTLKQAHFKAGFLKRLKWLPKQATCLANLSAL